MASSDIAGPSASVAKNASWSFGLTRRDGWGRRRIGQLGSHLLTLMCRKSDMARIRPGAAAPTSAAGPGVRAHRVV